MVVQIDAMRAKRTDKNQPTIVKQLRAAYCQCILTNMGDDYPDLMTAFREGWVLIEVKTLDGSLDRGQLQFLVDAKGYVGVAIDFDQAYKLTMFPRTHALKPIQQAKIEAWLINNEQETLSVRKFFKLIET